MNYLQAVLNAKSAADKKLVTSETRDRIVSSIMRDAAQQHAESLFVRPQLRAQPTTAAS